MFNLYFSINALPQQTDHALPRLERHVIRLITGFDFFPHSWVDWQQGVAELPEADTAVLVRVISVEEAIGVSGVYVYLEPFETEAELVYG